MVAGNVHLINLPQRQVTTHVGQGAQDASVTCCNTTSQRSRDKEVTHEHRHMVAPNAVDGGLATAFCGLVDDVVVDQ